MGLGVSDSSGLKFWPKSQTLALAGVSWPVAGGLMFLG